MEMWCVYCAALAECLNIIQTSYSFAYYQGYRKHLTIIKNYLLAYMWYPTFDIKKWILLSVLLELTCFNRKMDLFDNFEFIFTLYLF
jgi:hypothetical protein